MERSLINEVWHVLPTMSSLSGFYDLPGNFTQQSGKKKLADDMQGSII